MFRLFCIVAGYFIGCIQTAFIVGKICKTDLSKKGSGNLGTTNALRVLGFKAGAMTFMGDILKAVAAYVLMRCIFSEEPLLAGIYAGAGVILGHNFPFYIHFKGGKGIAATMGMALCIGFTGYMPVTLVAYALGIGIACMTKYISAGSMVFAVALPISGIFFHMPNEAVLLLTALAALALWQHRSNIGRLIAGNENKFTWKKQE